MPYRMENVNINKDTDGTVFCKFCFKHVVQVITCLYKAVLTEITTAGNTRQHDTTIQ